MKFILFSDSEERREKILSVFAEEGRQVISLKDRELLVNAVEKSNFPLVLIDVKFSSFPAYGISKELKERFSGKKMRTFLIMPSAEGVEKKTILELWLADGLIFYSELEEGVRRLLKQFPFVEMGNFKEKPFIRLLLEIEKRSFTGTLTVNRGGDEKAIYFEKGIARYSITSKSDEKIGQYLIRYNKLLPAELKTYLDDARNSGKRLGEFLIEKGIIERDEFREMLRKQLEEIFESIFAWDEADWTLSTENIAAWEDVLIGRSMGELIYNGVMKYAEVNEIRSSFFPELLSEAEEIFSEYPLNQKEKELVEMFRGDKSIELLSFKSECTLKQIQRLCYLLKESGYIQLLSTPKEVAKTVIGKIQPQEMRIEASIPEEVKETSPEKGEEKMVFLEAPEIQRELREEDIEIKPGYVSFWSEGFFSKMALRNVLKKRMLQNSIITISLIVVISLSVGLILKKRAEERLLNEKIIHSSELIKSDSLPALKNATQILSDCVKKNMSNHLISLLAFANFRIFELTNDRGYLEEAKKILQTRSVGNDEPTELKPLILLLSMAEGDMVSAGKVLNEIRASDSPISLYSQAKYTLESNGDTEKVMKILSSVTQQDMEAVKLELANAWSLSGNLDKLKEMLRDLRKEIPGHPDVIMLRGDEKYLEGNYNEAETLYRLSLDFRPGHVQTTIRLARTHLAMNQSESVVKELEPVIASTDIRTNCGKFARLYYARALQKLKNLEMAKELFSQLASVYPQDDSIKNDLESVEKMLKRRESKEEGKKETIKDLLKTAKKLYNKGRYEEAIKVFERGLDRADDEFLYWYALTLEGTGNSNAAFIQLKKAEGKNPENALVHKELGKLYKERGNEEESQNHFRLYLQYLKK